MEEWRKVPGVEPHIEASSLGRVRRPSFVSESVREGLKNTQRRTGVIFSPYIAHNGYLTIQLKANGRRTKYTVHRLIGRAFIEGYAPDLSINHIDGNKLNNSLGNLEWVTLARNTQHQWEIGLVNLRGENHPSHKLKEPEVIEIRKLIKSGVSCNSIALKLGVSPAIIYKIRDRKNWAHI
jgi:hypothetical protein